MNRPAAYDLGFADWQAWLARQGAPAFRARQIWHALYRELRTDVTQITTLPATLRQALVDEFAWDAVRVSRTQESQDTRTCKALLRLADNETVEAVLMRYAERNTVCVSTQVGCAMGCAFCATGQSGFTRNLTRGEIVAQVLWAARRVREMGEHTARGSAARLTNVVYMGMGEPFANYEETLSSLRRLNDPEGFGLGARSFTVSTVGIIPGIDRFSHEDIQANLAVSLHAAVDATRDRLVPANRMYPLDDLLAACRRYIERTHRRVTFEIALISGINDDVEHAEAVAGRLRGMLCHVNVIPLNAVPDARWAPSSRERVDGFAQHLEDAGIPTTVRHSMGSEIQAGCGQLRRRGGDQTSVGQ